MTGTIAVMLAFTSKSESVQSIGGADGMESVLPPGEQFMDIDLMADIPDEFIMRRAETTMQGDGQLHDTQVRPHMPAVPGEFGDQLLANLLRQQFALAQCQFLYVGWMIHHVQISTHKFSLTHRVAAAPARRLWNQTGRLTKDKKSRRFLAG